MKLKILGVALAAVTLSACDDESANRLPTRIVCHSAGQKTIDDYAKNGANLAEGGIVYTSQTTGMRTRVTGDCAAFGARKPARWKPLFLS